jgi:hypothetical protein
MNSSDVNLCSIKSSNGMRFSHIVQIMSFKPFCNRVWIEQYTSKKMSNVIEFLIRYWNDNPIPRYLQVDNGMYFIGDFKNPREFSRVVGLCLYVGIEVVFIAPSSPWMNGSIGLGTKFTYPPLRDQ